jgi:hypothetical protein
MTLSKIKLLELIKMIINLNKPLKKDSSYEQAFERLKVVMGGEELIRTYKPAVQPYLGYIGIRKKYVKNAIIAYLANGEAILYQFNVEEE